MTSPMNTCPHTPKYPALHEVPTLQEALSHCKMTEGNPEVALQRALTDGQTTLLDSAYWSNLNDAQRAAVVAHERAHPQIGMKDDCEGCADKVGGFFMRVWGHSPDTVRSSFASLNAHRKQDHGSIGDNATEGARAAEKGLASRGLLGKSSNEVASELGRMRGLTALEITKARRESAFTSPAAKAAQAGAIDPPLTSAVIPPESIVIAPPSGLPSPSGRTTPIAAPPSTPSTEATTPADRSPLDAVPAPEDTEVKAQIAPPSADATVKADTTGTSAAPDVAGDVVAAVLGEDARPHSGKVLIAVGVAATLAVILVIVVRRASK